MTPEERKLLEDLAGKIAQTPSPAHDAEAEEFIRTNIGKRPDALYLMTQTVLIQNMAIEHAQQEIEQWKRAAQAAPAAQPPAQGSFLGHGYAPPQPSYAPQQPGYAQPGYPQPGYAPQAPAPGGLLGGMFGGGAGMGSFLKSAGTTAAGVAAGALAFEGIRSMFGGAEHLFGFGNQPHMGGSGFFGGGGGGPVEETIVNNYYDGQEGGSGDRRSSLEDADTSNLGPDDSVQYNDTDVPVDDSSDFADDGSGGDDLV